MSKNRDKESDKAETKKLILHRELREKPEPGVKNWLGHGLQRRGNGRLGFIDDRLLDGATREELERVSEWPWGHIHKHMFESLPSDHDLKVVQVDDKYMFDREHLGIDDCPLPEEISESGGLPEGRSAQFRSTRMSAVLRIGGGVSRPMSQPV